MFKIDKFSEVEGLFHCFSTIDDGNMSFLFGDEEEVKNNRSAFINETGLQIENTAIFRGVHGNEVVEVEKEWLGISIFKPDLAPKVDGFTTNKKGICLAMLAADCVPIFIFDHRKKALALVHAGWKSTDEKIVTKAIERLSGLYDTKPSDLIVAIGPAARKESYVKKNPKQKNDLKWQNFIQQTTDDDYSIDIVGYNIWQLIESGVKESNIIDPKIDTAMDDRFYSHITDKDKAKNEQGRFMCVVALM